MEYDVTDPDAPAPTELTAEIIVGDLAYANELSGWFTYEPSETDPGTAYVTQYGFEGQLLAHYEVEMTIRKIDDGDTTA
ncbi:hypothetical protein [Agromyces humi]|uniref:hypothetical protein n=1 Tax=Agromyces humi TaxID=1766800 RepID=UPI00135CA13F|nr:hypothetical protein [Agromyces humi]